MKLESQNIFVSKMNKFIDSALASSGIVSACGIMGREIESRQGIGWQF
jgi:hypothetical protein